MILYRRTLAEGLGDEGLGDFNFQVLGPGGGTVSEEVIQRFRV